MTDKDPLCKKMEASKFAKKIKSHFKPKIDKYVFESFLNAGITPTRDEVLEASLAIMMRSAMLAYMRLEAKMSQEEISFYIRELHTGESQFHLHPEERAEKSFFKNKHDFINYDSFNEEVDMYWVSLKMKPFADMMQKLWEKAKEADSHK